MALTVTKSTLLRYIGRKLGLLTDSRLASTLSGAALIDATDVLDTALRSFYEPNVLPEEVGRSEKHQWSFLFSTQKFSLQSGVWRYLLPADFSMFNGPLTFTRGEDTCYPAIEMTAPEHIYRMQQKNSSGGVPKWAARETAMNQQGLGTRHELVVYPTPSADYVLDLSYKINPYSLDADAELPLGGQAHVQTIISACLAAAADFDEYEGDKYERRFIDHLRSSISHDRKLSAPQYLGINTDTSDGAEVNYMRPYGGSSIVTYEGTSY